MSWSVELPVPIYHALQGCACISVAVLAQGLLWIPLPAWHGMHPASPVAAAHRFIEVEAGVPCLHSHAS